MAVKSFVKQIALFLLLAMLASVEVVGGGGNNGSPVWLDDIELR